MTKPKEAIQVWPRPQEAKFSGGGVSASLKLVVRGEADWLAPAAKEAEAVLNRASGRPVVKRDGRAPLLVTDMGQTPSGLKAVKSPEGYALSVTEKGIHLAGADAAGVFYGAQTLAQCLEGAGGRGFPGLCVRDWPRYEFRGAHLYMPPRAHLDFFWKFLDFLAAYKCNVIFLEIGGGLEYEKHPEINRAWKKFCREALAYDYDKDGRIPESKRSNVSQDKGSRLGPCGLQACRYFAKDSTHTELAGGEWLTKDEARRIARECARRHIEIIPEVQSLSHSYYLCGAHPEIAEHHEDPWPDTYCPSNPKSYELLFDVMDEVIEVFHPRFISIGHDEAYTFRICPRCRRRTAHEILADEITQNHDFLASRGVGTMMWGDKLMNITTADGRRYGGIARSRKDPGTGKKWVQPATFKAADMVPKDLVILDWYWGLDPKSERNFHKHGFHVVYGNFSPMGFANWEKRADLPYVHGAEMSSWCEVSPYAFGHNGTLYQFFPGADMLWNGKQMPRAEVSRLMARKTTPAMEALTGQERWLVSGGLGRAEPVDLSGAAVGLPASLAGKVKCGGRAATVLETGDFRLIADGKALAKAVVLDKAAGSGAAVIAVGGKARKVLVVAGTTMEGLYSMPTYYSYHRGPAELIRYEVHYADGKRKAFQAMYREDVGQITGAWPAGGHCFRAVPVDAGEGHTLYAQEWTNPRPNSAIRSIRIALGADATEKGEVIVAAISLVR